MSETILQHDASNALTKDAQDPEQSNTVQATQDGLESHEAFKIEGNIQFIYNERQSYDKNAPAAMQHKMQKEVLRQN